MDALPCQVERPFDLLHGCDCVNNERAVVVQVLGRWPLSRTERIPTQTFRRLLRRRVARVCRILSHTRRRDPLRVAERLSFF